MSHSSRGREMIQTVKDQKDLVPFLFHLSFPLCVHVCLSVCVRMCVCIHACPCPVVLGHAIYAKVTELLLLLRRNSYHYTF